MDILRKIAKDELIFWLTFHRILRNRYSRVPIFGRNKFLYEPIANMEDYLQRPFHEPTRLSRINYNDVIREYQTDGDKIYSLLCLDLKKSLVYKVITYAEMSRIKRLARGDISSVNLAKVIVNNYRNKRLRKERYARAKKARL